MVKIRTGTENEVYLIEANGGEEERRRLICRKKNADMAKFCPGHTTYFMTLHKALPDSSQDPPPSMKRSWHTSYYCCTISWRSTNYFWEECTRLKYSQLELPGVLNWEVSRNFRGVDKLVTSMRGTEESFTRELWEEKELKQTVHYDFPP